MPATNPVIVLLVPVPAIAPGLIVQFPAGRPPKVTLPVATEQVGCTILLIVGAEGVTGCGLIITLADASDVHPTEFVTVKLYVPANKNEMVVLAEFPVMDPGLTVQFPDGRPLIITLPVAILQVGWVIVPGIGAAGVIGCVLITISVDASEVHPETLVTV